MPELTVIRNPLLGEANKCSLPNGTTVREAVGEQGPPGESLEWRAILNGREIPAASSQVLGGPDHLHLICIPEGGDFGFRDVALLAVSVFAPYAAGVFGGVGSATLNALVNAGAALVGATLVNALFPPERPSRPSEEGQSFTFRTPRMTASPGLPIPVVYGQRRLGGNVLNYAVEGLGKQQRMLLVNGLCEGPIEDIGHIWFGHDSAGEPLPSTGFQVIKSGTSNQGAKAGVSAGWTTGTEGQLPPAEELGDNTDNRYDRAHIRTEYSVLQQVQPEGNFVIDNSGGPHTYGTEAEHNIPLDEYDRAWVTLIFPRGKTGNGNDKLVEVKLEYREKGDSTWQPFPAQVGSAGSPLGMNIAGGSSTTDGVVEFDFGHTLQSWTETFVAEFSDDPNSTPPSQYEFRFERLTADTDEDQNITEVHLLNVVVCQTDLREIRGSYTPSGSSPGGNSYTTSVDIPRRVSSVDSGDSDSISSGTLTDNGADFPSDVAGNYVRMLNISVEPAEVNVSSRTNATTISLGDSTFNGEEGGIIVIDNATTGPIKNETVNRYAEVAVLGLTIRSNETLSGRLPRVSALVKGRKVYDPVDSTRSYRTNPAWVARDILHAAIDFGEWLDETDSDLDRILKDSFDDWETWADVQVPGGSTPTVSYDSGNFSSGQLIDPDASFTSDGTSAGDFVWSIEEQDSVEISSVDSEDQVTLTDSSLDGASGAYQIHPSSDMSTRSQIDIAFDETTTIWDAVREVANIGRAQILHHGTRFEAVIDQQQSVTQVFGEGSISNLSVEYPELDSRAEIVQVDYTDGLKADGSESSWQRQKVFARASGAAPDNVVKTNRVTSVEARGIIRQEQAERHAMLQWMHSDVERRIIQFHVPPEGVLSTIGDHIQIATEVSEFGVASGRLVSGGGTSVTIDRRVQFDQADDYTIVLRDPREDPSNSGATIERAISNDAGTAQSLTLGSSVTLSSPVSDWTYAIYKSSEALFDARIIRKQRDRDEHVQITAVDYNSDLYDHIDNWGNYSSNDRETSSIGS